MQVGNVTTPFGRRSMTLGMLASQAHARDIEPGQTVDKWKLFRALCEARPLLGITDRALAVLNALLSFYPKAELAEENGLVVFPSNIQLSLRTHGMAETTLRRHLAALVEAGLLIRKDSANGKRFAHKDKTGNIDEAFGFSLAPLLARAGEIEHLAAEVVAERLHLQRLKERMTLCRRDIAKLIEAALEEGAGGDWGTIYEHFRSLVVSVPRAVTANILAPILEEMEMLREEIVNLLENQVKVQKTDGNPGQTERHIQNSNPESITELEPRFEKKQGAISADQPQPLTGTVRRGQANQPESGTDDRSMPQSLAEQRRIVPGGPPVKAFPLALVLQACPDITMYGPGGAIGNWRDLMAAAVVVRSMLGVSPSAYQQACAVMGPENAATVIACILERAGHINSAGGYLRDLTRRAELGEFGLGPMLMALARGNGPVVKRAG